MGGDEGDVGAHSGSGSGDCGGSGSAGGSGTTSETAGAGGSSAAVKTAVVGGLLQTVLARLRILAASDEGDDESTGKPSLVLLYNGDDGADCIVLVEILIFSGAMKVFYFLWRLSNFVL